MKEPIRLLELEEYLYAHTEAQQNRDPANREVNIRELLWSHRFFIFTWLMMNGVAIPAELVSDNTHKRVGQQSVDITTHSGA